MIKAIIFDLDDTLYKEMQFLKGGFKAVSSFIAQNSNISQKRFYQLLSDVLAKYGRGHTFDIALKEIGLYDQRLIPELINIYRMHKPNLLLYPEVRPILTALKQYYALGLITDGNVEVQRNKVKALKIESFFDCIIFSYEYGIEKQKPNPFSYQKIIEKLRVNPNESIYVGDNPYKDFVNAKKLGMHTFRIRRGQYKKVTLDVEYEADYQIKSFNEIFDIINRINKKTDERF